MRIKNHSLSLHSLTEVSTHKEKLAGPATMVGLTVMIYFVSQIAGGLLVSIYPAIKGWSLTTAELWFKSSIVAQFFLILSVEVLVVAAVLFLLALWRVKPRVIGLVRPKIKEAAYAVAGFGIYFLLYLAVFVIVRAIFPQIDFEQKQEIGFESAKEGLDLVLIFVSLAVLPPIAEEILCRGFLYTGLREKWPVYKWPFVVLFLATITAFFMLVVGWPLLIVMALDLGIGAAIIANRKYPRITAALLVSLLFATAHLQFGSGSPLLWAAAIDTFVLSLVLIYFREIRGNLTAPILLHMLKNSAAFMLLFIFKVG